MAAVARPTHRAHARTPLTHVRTHNSQWPAFESWVKVADPAPSASLALVSSARRDRPRPTYRLHGAVLWLAGSLLAWMRTWDASAAAYSARSSLVGCMDMILIGIAARLQYGARRYRRYTSGKCPKDMPCFGSVSDW